MTADRTERPLENIVRRFRRFVAKRLVLLAFKVDPTSPEVLSFMAKQAFDMAVYGGAVTHIDYAKLRDLPKYDA